MPTAPEMDIILGADGFLGANLGAYFTAHGRAWHGVFRRDGDLTDKATARRLLQRAPKAARIFHLVTRQRTGPSQFQIQGELLAINTAIHLNVLEAWRLHQPQAKLISMGSSCTYPESTQPLPESLFGAGGAHPSVYGYAHGKLTIATGSRAYAEQYGLSWLHCVLATLYGPKDHRALDRTHFLGAMLDRAVLEKRAGASAFTVWGAPGTVREVLHVQDQIRAILAADAAFSNRVINCAANMPVTVGAAAHAVLRALNWDVMVSHPPGSFQGADYKVLNSSVFLDTTGFAPRITLDDGLSALLAEEYSHV
jgi:GDP-L-fucose synthase